MILEYYSDILLASNPLPQNVARTIHKLHPLMVRQPGTYALAFPRMKAGNLSGDLPEIGPILRVFARNREAIEAALDHLESGSFSSSALSPILQVGRVRPVPSDHDGAWVSYQRLRIPAVQGVTEQHREKRALLREKRAQDAKGLPYVILTSASTKRKFSLFVNPVRQDTKPEQSAERCDGYGLSSRESPVWLPDLHFLGEQK